MLGKRECAFWIRSQVLKQDPFEFDDGFFIKNHLIDIGHGFLRPREAVLYRPFRECIVVFNPAKPFFCCSSKHDAILNDGSCGIVVVTGNT